MSRERIRVLQIVPDFSLGGAERMAVHLVRHLDPQRFETAIVSLYDPIGGDLDDLLAASDHRVWHLAKQPGFDIRMFFAIRRVLREFRPHVVHTHTITLRYAFAPAWWARIPVRLHTIHSLADKEAGRFAWVRRLAFRLGVIPVTIATEVQKGVRELYGIADAPNIPNGIPVKEYAHPKLARGPWREQVGLGPNDLVLATVGRIDASKNQALLIRALGAMGNRVRPRLLIVGEGDATVLQELRDLVQTLKLGERVHFLGRRTDIPDLLAASDVFVLPSNFEGNPLTILEAMAAGLPVIATAVGGVPELVEDGISGLLTPVGAVEPLAQALLTLAGDPDRRATMGREARKRAAQRFDVSTMASAYATLYQERLGDRAT